MPLLPDASFVINWLVPLAIPLCALLGVLFFFQRFRRQKQERLELRLLVGREKLLGEEVERHRERLRTFDQNSLDALRQQAETTCDDLHMQLIERQAYLLSCEDLAHLQDCKINLLLSRLETAPTPPPSSPSPQSPSPASPPPQDRTQLENQLLSQIGDRQKTAPRRKRPNSEG